MVFNLFNSESKKHYKHIFIRTHANYKNNKKTHPTEWNDAYNVVKICKTNNFKLKSYIKYCFLNKLVHSCKGQTIQDIKYLTKFPQISSYAKNKEEIEKLYSIYINILKTILRIKKICKDTNISVKSTLKSILTSGQLSNYIMTGVISKNFLALIPNIDNFLHERLKKACSEDLWVIESFCANIKELAFLSHKAMNMFWPEASRKTIIEICSN